MMWSMTLQFSKDMSDAIKKVLKKIYAFFLIVFAILIFAISYMVYVEYVLGIIISVAAFVICAAGCVITIRVLHKSNAIRTYTCSTAILSKGYVADDDTGDFRYNIYVNVYKNYTDMPCSVKVSKILYDALDIGDTVKLIRIEDDYENIRVLE